MKRLLSLLPVCFVLVLSFISCDKGSTPVKSNTELLTQNTWKFSAVSAGGVDITASIDPCYKDNIIAFNASGGAGTVDESAIVCMPSTAGSFTWAFENNETDLNLSATLIPGGSGSFDIITLTETTLVLAKDMTIAPFPTTNVRVTLVH